MRAIPKKLLHEMLDDPYYSVCARHDPECDGRITLEHAIIVAGRQLNERWAIIPLCAWHHAVDQYQDGPGLNKDINRLIALSRATTEELLAYPRSNFIRERDYLLAKYPDAFAPAQIAYSLFHKNT